MPLSFAGRLILFVALMPLASTTVADEAWLPLTRLEVFELLAKSDAVKMKTWEDLKQIRNMKSQSAPNKVHYWVATAPEVPLVLPHRNPFVPDDIAPDEIVSVAVNPAIPLTINMAGKDDRIHSLRVMIPIVNYSDVEGAQIFKVVSALFKRIFPDWQEAEDWPRQSLVRAWDAHPFIGKTPLKDINDMIIRHEKNGITSATFGVPPDIIIYAVTVREKCLPKVDQSDPAQVIDPIQRLVC